MKVNQIKNLSSDFHVLILVRYLKIQIDKKNLYELW